MTTDHLLNRILQMDNLYKRMVFGAITATGLFFGFLLFAYFFGEAKGNLDIRIVSPLSTVTIAGAFGGAFHFLMDRLRKHGSQERIAANILSVLFFIFICWMSLVVGFAAIGMWD